MTIKAFQPHIAPNKPFKNYINKKRIKTTKTQSQKSNRTQAYLNKA